MSWFLNSIPYILAGATILLGVFQVVKEWDEYDKNPRLQRLRIAVLLGLIVIGGLTFVSLHFDNKAKAEERSKSEGNIRELTTKVQAANDAQKDNTKLFLGSFDAMSKEVSNLKAEVKTEALQKKLTTVQEELQKTQKAMAPGPKAELTFTFLPFDTYSSSTTPVTDVDLPMNLDGTVHVEAGALNMTSVDASDVDLNIQICEQCKYAKEPADTVKLTGFSDTVRLLKTPHVQARQVLTSIILDITAPPGTKSFQVGFSYRCSTCVVTTKASLGIVHILGLQSPSQTKKP